MSTGFFDLKDILNVARKHPFYSSATYPLPPKEVARISDRSLDPKTNGVAASRDVDEIQSMLSEFPILGKQDLYNVSSRLYNDDDFLNTYRQSTYISTTGGGGGSSELLVFLTDINENRNQRAACGNLARSCGLLNENDCVLSLHVSRNLYRALDLITDISEYAGASVLPVGHLASLQEVIAFIKNHNPTVIAGDTSQIISFASHVVEKELASTLSIKKILATSESMTQVQRDFLHSTFGSIPIISIFASAESGPWAVSNPEVTGLPPPDTIDFIFDSRQVIVEVLPLDFQYSEENRHRPCELKMGEKGQLAITSLQRLRHPLIRYLNGDLGSVHELPAKALANITRDAKNLLLLRLYGRNKTDSFEWHGEYIEFSKLKQFMSKPDYGILMWQVILHKDKAGVKTDHVEVRLVRKNEEWEGTHNFCSWEKLVADMKSFFGIHEGDELFNTLFRVLLSSSEDLVRSSTGNKVVNFVVRET